MEKSVAKGIDKSLTTLKHILENVITSHLRSYYLSPFVGVRQLEQSFETLQHAGKIIQAPQHQTSQIKKASRLEGFLVDAVALAKKSAPAIWQLRFFERLFCHCLV